MDPYGPDPREGDVPAVGFDADRTGGEGDPVAVAALLREPGEPGGPALACSGARRLTVPVGVHCALDAVGERLLADLRPPHLAGFGVGAFGVLDLVPSLPQAGQRRRLGRGAGLLVPSDVLFEGADGRPGGSGSPGRHAWSAGHVRWSALPPSPLGKSSESNKALEHYSDLPERELAPCILNRQTGVPRLQTHEPIGGRGRSGCRSSARPANGSLWSADAHYATTAEMASHSDMDALTSAHY
jgi:hypothetical protein